MGGQERAPKDAKIRTLRGEHLAQAEKFLEAVPPRLPILCTRTPTPACTIHPLFHPGPVPGPRTFREYNAESIPLQIAAGSAQGCHDRE